MKTKVQAFFKGFARLAVGLSLLAGLLVFPAQAAASSPGTPATPTPPTAGNHPTPMLAYYYIWYDTTSWDRAKIDFPLEGKYSSDDPAVMRQHIQWAKAAGIDGFIVSWKSTDVLNRRLAQLADLAEAENFKLAVIYQGLDFNRNPLPVDRIASDLDYFIKNFAHRPAFDLYSRPLVIWSGTWKYTAQEVAQVTQARRADLLLLASERDVAGYQRLNGLVDGNAYYWSSVNPDTYPGYAAKLADMGQAVHQKGGLWIAPAAPGFDARQIGGTTTVDRQNGQTFRTEINTAMASSPDALGIISWNEFSENSYIEPSQAYGRQYLDILGEVIHQPAPDVKEFDSSIPAGIFAEVMPNSRAVALVGLVVIILSGFIIIARRRA